MAEAESISASPQPSSDGTVELEKFSREFWDTYQDSGIVLAARYFEKEVNGNLPITQLLVPHIVREGHERGIEMGEFITKMQDIIVEKDNATTDVDDGGRVPVISDNETDNPQDEDESAPERADDQGPDGQADD